MAVDDEVWLRGYEPRDLAAMVELDANCFDSSFRFDRRSMRQFAGARNAWSQIAVANNVIAGFCIIHREQAHMASVGYLVTIDVAAAYRRRGIGEHMLAEGESWLRASGAAAMLLHVYVRNEGAIRFYEHAGYERDGVKLGFYGPGKDAALFWKRLHS